MDFPTLATFFSGVSFIFYGAGCLTTSHMKSEFIRYGYDRQRVLTGYLQLLGAMGLLIGYWTSPWLAFGAALGLGLMMVFGFGVRLKIKDGFWASSPAFLYAVLNLYLSVHYGSIL
ncbi:DoxX family protein [Neolewinella persica]|uniref:DoxX family protein n=1 Tax=Neolewinella persica TaxID=70998 RepID=UPI0003633A69|nr:DoxX family protein [Neolewinella persica]